MKVPKISVHSPFNKYPNCTTILILCTRKSRNINILAGVTFLLEIKAWYGSKKIWEREMYLYYIKICVEVFWIFIFVIQIYIQQCCGSGLIRII